MSKKKNINIYDCFLFNGEFDILELRLNLMYDYVDEFILVEASKTFTGLNKTDLLSSQIERFKKYDKLKVITIDQLPSTTNAWENEFFLRNALLKNFPGSDDDIIILSDVDEVLNLKLILFELDYSLSYIIQIPCYYYFANLQSSEIFSVNYIGPFSKIKNKDIGNRLLFKNYVDSILLYSENSNYGMHLTYQFGYNFECYIQKLKSFSHQEFNNQYFTNKKRLNKVVGYYYDLYDRWYFSFKIVSNNDFMKQVSEVLLKLPDNKIVWRKPNLFIKVTRPFFLFTIKSYRIFLVNNWKHKFYVFLNKHKLK